jgi:hypothetical protein
MLAEKFILFLEALLESDRYPDGSLRVQSMAPHVPLVLSGTVKRSFRVIEGDKA